MLGKRDAQISGPPISFVPPSNDPAFVHQFKWFLLQNRPTYPADLVNTWRNNCDIYKWSNDGFGLFIHGFSDSHCSWYLIPTNYDSFDKLLHACNVIYYDIKDEGPFAFTPSAVVDSPRWLIFFSDSGMAEGLAKPTISDDLSSFFLPDSSLLVHPTIMNSSVTKEGKDLNSMSHSELLSTFILNDRPLDDIPDSLGIAAKKRTAEDTLKESSPNKKKKKENLSAVVYEVGEAALNQLSKAP